MSFPRDAYPYTNFHELNLGYFIVHFREIFSQWADLYDQMLDWKDATTDELTAWKTGVEADLDQREAALRAELETWKAQTGQDIAGWEDATLAALTAWQTATQAVFEAIRIEAASSASAAAASAGDAATAKTAAETAQAAAEAAAASIASAAAQITTNTSDIADLQSAVDQITDFTESKNLFNLAAMTPGYVNQTNGKVVESTSHGVSEFIPITEDFTISADRSLTSAGLRICFYSGNSENDFISGEQVPASSETLDSTLNRYYIVETVPNNTAYIRFSTTAYTSQYTYNIQVEEGITPTAYEAYSEGEYKIKENALPGALTEELTAIQNNITEIQGDITSIEGDIADIQEELNGIIDVVEMLTFTTSAGYMSTTGDVVDSGPGTYGHTSKISVTPGDKIIAIPKVNGKSLILRFVCAYNGESIVSASGATSVAEYTVPDGIDGIVITGFCAISGDPSTIPNFFKFTKGVKPKKSQYNTWTENGNLSDGDSLILPINNIAKNRVITFDAIISTFSAIKIGRTAYSNGIRIDGTNVEILNNSGSVVSTTAHGLTIANNISVRIVHDISVSQGNIKIFVSSNGVNASEISVSWSNSSSENPVVTSDGSTLSDCRFTYAATDINKKIFGFGDSYFSISDTRWIGQLKNCGYINNLLLNAYSGESATQNIPALFNIIAMGSAKYILWANGMNDGGDSSQDEKPSDQWTNAVRILLTLCKEYDVIPILCTIPTVPTVNNEYKNAWIRESEYRYIDFAKAVGADSSGNWYDGMLETNTPRVHPTETGAVALCNRAIADFGELTQAS